jgi:serine/threonine protein phosphatase PrpC
MTLALRYAVRSDVGLLREGNEDSAYAGPHLLAVADGMGGHAAGEVASAATITTMAALDRDRVGGDLAGRLADAVASANMRLQELIIADPATEGMGTTLTAILWSEGHAALCHIGDSRAYLLRDGQFYQITHDHTLVQSLVDEGKITEEDIATHPHRSLLLRALDGRTVAEPDLSVHETMPGDRYLLCSDGLSGVVTEQTLHQTLRSAWDPDKAAMQLIELAIKGGGPDNITCIVADVIDTATASAGPGNAGPYAPAGPGSLGSYAGAAANGAPTPSHPGGGMADPGNGQAGPQRPSSPATRAMQLARTNPQPQLADPAAGNGYGGVDAATRPDGYTHPAMAPVRRKRRWPIVTGVLVLLVVIIGGGLIAGWQYVRGQYYIGTQAGDVAIFRGVDQNVAGISMSSLTQRSSLPVAQLGTVSRAQVNQTISYGSLRQAQDTVGGLQQQAARCQQSYQALAQWQTADTTYRQQLAAYNKIPAAQKKGKQKPTPPPPEPAQPASSAVCAPSTAFGVPVSALPASQAGGENPTATPTASPGATSPAKVAPTTGKSA